MKLNNKGFGLKEMIILSSILIFVLLFMAYYIIVLYKNFDDGAKGNYAILENRIKNAAIKYVDEYEHSNIVTLNELKTAEILDFFTDKNDNNCDGYVIVEDMTFTPYIKCPNYTTKGYRK